MKATREKQRKRHAAGTSVSTRKVVGNTGAARALTEHVVQFKDGTRMKVFAPPELSEQVAKTEGLRIVEVGARLKETTSVRGVGFLQRRAGKTEPSHPPERASDQIVTMATKLTGTKAKAQDWYKTFPIPAFGGLTAEFLVDRGRAKEVREYLNAVVLGEFA